MELGIVNIILNNREHRYHPGDLLEGTLEIELPCPRKIKSVYIKFEGTGTVKFHHPVPLKRHGRIEMIDTLFYSNETYLKHRTYCLKNQGDAINLAKGRHIYPFTYQLPYDIPSSYIHERGTINYNLVAVLEHPKAVKQKISKDLYIGSQLDLTLYPFLREPGIVCVERIKRFLWQEVSKFKIIVKIPRTGYTIGESIFIYAEVHNTSSKLLEDIRFELRKIMTFYAHSPKKENKQFVTTLAKANLGAQPARNLQNFTLDLLIPQFRYHNLNGSKIINIQYDLEVTVVRGGHHSNLIKRIPISIGAWSQTLSADQFQIDMDD